MSVLTFATDYTTDKVLDSELVGAPESGLFYNQGVHPLVTINNLLKLLPFFEGTFAAYDNGKTYSNYTVTRNFDDVVEYDGKLYSSKVDNNVGNQPDSSPIQWLETNIESLTIKSFIHSVKLNMYSALGLQNKLIERQFYYSIGDEKVTPNEDYFGWMLMPKGSDYVTISIDEIAFQSSVAGPVNLYVVNQHTLLQTIPINSSQTMNFQKIDLELSGFGPFYLLTDKAEVFTKNDYVDPLLFKSFYAQPVVGNGATPEAADLKDTFQTNGFNFKITTRKSPQKYIEDNLINYANLLQVQFAYDFLKVIKFNANTRLNFVQQLIGAGLDEILVETVNLEGLTLAKWYYQLLKETKRAISNSNDNQIKPAKKFVMKSRVL
jgi:hypothetical protein